MTAIRRIQVWEALFAFLVICPLVAQAEGATGKWTEETMVIRDLGNQIKGAVLANGEPVIDFSSDYSLSDRVEIKFRYGTQEVTVSVALQAKKAQLSSSGLVGEKVVYRSTDQAAFKKLLYHLQLNTKTVKEMYDPINTDAFRLLIKSTELLSLRPPGGALNASISAPVTKGWVSLCDEVDNWVTAYWTNSNSTRFKNFVVGGHGVCKGHCGAGCPAFGDDPNYYQDCLNHDACAGEEGQQLGVCGDEWSAAADDFLFGPDC